MKPMSLANLALWVIHDSKVKAQALRETEEKRERKRGRRRAKR